MVPVYGLEESKKCIAPSACAVVVELMALAISSTGPFSLLVAFELPASSKQSDSHLPLLPPGQQSCPCLAPAQASKRAPQAEEGL